MLKSLLLPFAALALVSVSSQAAVVRVSWNTTQTTGSSRADYLALGEAWTLTLLVDNGGTSLANQTWTAASFVGIEALSAGGDTFFSATAPTVQWGSFVTNASGALRAVPSEWSAGLATVTTSEPFSGSGGWYVNGFNQVLSGSPTARDRSTWNAANVGDLVVASNWTASFAPVPEPGSALLGLAGIAGMVSRRRRSA